VARVTGIDHVQVAAPPGCETEARRFYGELLGLEEIEKPEELKARGGVWFRCGAQELHVGVQEDFRPSSKAHPGLSTAGIEELAAELDRAGSPTTWDGPRFYTEDPWGNRLELVPAT
jgi:catechol 2,3-dioxygenase-like lactoylglutathione lyase family enzyme